MKVEIIGYTQEENCDHCGRALKHVVITDCLGKIGTTCFLKLTKNKTFYGKEYSLTPTIIKDYARSTRYTEQRRADFGIYPHHLVFELKD